MRDFLRPMNQRVFIQRVWYPWTKGFLSKGFLSKGFLSKGFDTHEPKGFYPKGLIPMNQRVFIQRFWYPWTKGFLSKGFDTHDPKGFDIHEPKILCKRGAKPPTCKDVCYHRYPEMSGVLCYRLRAVPLVKRPQWTKCFSINLSSLFFEKGFCNPSSKDFRIFIFIWSSIFIFSFF